MRHLVDTISVEPAQLVIAPPRAPREAAETPDGGFKLQQAITGCAHIVDDEEAVRFTLASALESGGFATRQYASAEELLQRLAELEPGCIVTDVRMPGMGGLDLVRRLNAEGVKTPVIVISGQADVALAVAAMKVGAVDFLEKPIRSAALQAVVRDALQRPALPPSAAAELYTAVLRTLTRRQRDVLAGLLEGLSNKLIGHRLGLSIRTVEAYRAAIMDRTRVKSLSELIRISVLAGL